jgi:hypothetical protein
MLLLTSSLNIRFPVLVTKHEGLTDASAWEVTFSYLLKCVRSGLSNAAPAGAMAPVIYFPGALIYSAGFNVNQNFKKKYFWITVCFNFFRSTHMKMVFPLLQSCFLLYQFYCPLTPHFPFTLKRKRRHLKSSLQTNTASEPTLLWGTGHYYCRGVTNLSSLNSPSRALSCL